MTKRREGDGYIIIAVLCVAVALAVALIPQIRGKAPIGPIVEFACDKGNQFFDVSETIEDDGTIVFSVFRRSPYESDYNSDYEYEEATLWVFIEDYMGPFSWTVGNNVYPITWEPKETGGLRTVSKSDVKSGYDSSICFQIDYKKGVYVDAFATFTLQIPKNRFKVWEFDRYLLRIPCVGPLFSPEVEDERYAERIDDKVLHMPYLRVEGSFFDLSVIDDDLSIEELPAYCELISTSYYQFRNTSYSAPVVKYHSDRLEMLGDLSWALFGILFGAAIDLFMKGVVKNGKK